MTTARDLACPKCSGRMGSYERSGIVVEQCEDCRGMFLDRGELERLIDAEGGGWSGVIGEPSGRPGAGSRGMSPDARDGGGDRDQRDGPAPRSTRREGRLGGLLDLLGGE
jgi:uncharacterized protein